MTRLAIDILVACLYTCDYACMAQMTWRADDELMRRVREVAIEHGWSVNYYVTFVLDAATDPHKAGDAAARLRERLARAGLLAEITSQPSASRVDDATFAAARHAAGQGTPLSDLVDEGRGE